MDKIVVGDCLDHLQNLSSGTVDLVYLDPPFFTQRQHSLSTRDEKKVYAFSDVWDSLNAYLAFMNRCIFECHRILRDTGSIFLHCDKSASHHLRVLLDNIFSAEMFQSEIIWNYRRWSNMRKGLLNAHQTIYFYSKTELFKFNQVFTDYAPSTNIDQILQRRARDERGKAIYDRDTDGETLIGPEKHGVPLSDVWQIPYLNPKARERCGYPTQKPLLLLERIINMTTSKGDTVLDPFCGSGTTMVAAKLLQRNTIGIDISRDAVNLAQERLRTLVKTRSALMELGEDSYITKNELELSILKSIGAVPVQRNAGIDGFLRKQVDGRPVAVRIQQSNETLHEAIAKLKAAASAKKCGKFIVLKTSTKNSDLFGESFICDENTLVIDAYELIIDAWLDRKSAIASQIS